MPKETIKIRYAKIDLTTAAAKFKSEEKNVPTKATRSNISARGRMKCCNIFFP
jgi:hypothetical protein